MGAVRGTRKTVHALEYTVTAVLFINKKLKILIIKFRHSAENLGSYPVHFCLLVKTKKGITNLNKFQVVTEEAHKIRMYDIPVKSTESHIKPPANSKPATKF